MNNNPGIVSTFLGGCFTLIFIGIVLGLGIAFGEWVFSLF